jgi:small subunit ribosomal protein S1
MRENRDLNKAGTVFVEDESESMEALMKEIEQTQEVKPQAKITVKIIAKSKDGFVVDLGTKVDGIIPFSDYEDSVIPPELKEGASVKVKVMDMRGGQIKLSHRVIIQEEAIENLEKSFEQKQLVSASIVKAIKGGFIADAGMRAFVPMSHIDTIQVRDPNQYIGKTYQFLIIEFDKYKRHIVLSRKKILEKQKEETKKALLANLAEGQIIDGVVNSIVKFGAFIDLGGIDGLLHIGEIAWYKINKVEDHLHKGQKVSVKIIKIDKESERIFLSIKTLIANPWESVAQKFPIGMVTKGKVSGITEGGAFVELEAGIDGFLPNAEYAWNDSIGEMKKNVKKAEERKTANKTNLR